MCVVVDTMAIGCPFNPERGTSSPVEEFRGSGRKDTSFASEAIEEENPCEQTKMVT